MSILSGDLILNRDLQEIAEIITRWYGPDNNDIWFHTPLKEFDGKTPLDIIEYEEAGSTIILDFLREEDSK